MLKCWSQLRLLKATKDDTSSMLTQIKELKSFVAQVATLSGKGTSSMTHERADRTQICATKAYAVEFANKQANQEVSEESNNPQVFVPSSGVWDRPFKRKNIEGTFVNKEKSKKGRSKIYRNMHLGLGRQLQEASSIIAKENADSPINCSSPCAQEPPEEDFPEVVLLAGLDWRKCHGCKGEF